MTASEVNDQLRVAHGVHTLDKRRGQRFRVMCKLAKFVSEMRQGAEVHIGD
jgi:hypothetical protein